MMMMIDLSLSFTNSNTAVTHSLTHRQCCPSECCLHMWCTAIGSCPTGAAAEELSHLDTVGQVLTTLTLNSEDPTVFFIRGFRASSRISYGESVGLVAECEMENVVATTKVLTYCSRTANGLVTACNAVDLRGTTPGSYKAERTNAVHPGPELAEAPLRGSGGGSGV
eukprot:scpid28437/ scgid7722/ 